MDFRTSYTAIDLLLRDAESRFPWGVLAALFTTKCPSLSHVGHQQTPDWELPVATHRSVQWYSRART